VREKSLGAVSHQEVPFEMILERLENQLGGRDKPAIQALFLFQRAFMQPAQHGELAIRPLRSVSPGTTFEFTLGVVERAEGVRLQMEYNTELLENATVRRMLLQFQMLLEAAVENPDALIGELPLLTQQERRRFWPETAPTAEVNPKSVIRFLDRQIQEHFRYAARPSGVAIEPPAGVRMAVLDPNLRLQPIGVPGEIYVGGPFSKETAASGNSVNGPLDAAVPVPLVCTGFIGCVRESGVIELQGAKADFVHVGGFRTNLRQIKSLLLRHPAVSEAAATVFNERGETQLVAYVVLKTGASAFEKELIAFLKGKVSDTALPARVVTVASMFKDPRGDVVTELLPKPQKVARPDGEKVPLGAILHQQLMEIWTDILRIPSVGLDDNFFALGGSSLLALRMIMQVEKLCGRPLPLSILLTGATISNLAHHIAEANSESALPLITVQPNGKRQPLYFLHGDWAGGGFYCGRLAQQLGENQPFYALPPYRSGRDETLTMEEMAAFHIAAMREHRPHGPYLIGGYCIGATVAVEMARQLVEQGEKVTRLLLVDAPLWGPRWLRWVWPVIEGIGRLANWSLQEKIYLFDRYGVSFGRWLKRSPHSKLMTLYRRLGIGPRRAAAAKRAESDLTEDDEILQSTDYAVYFLAYRLYKLKAIPVPATLYFPEATAPKRLAWVMKASSSAPVKFAVEILPGDHHTCITKHTAALATKMKNTLDSL
jgi:pimeloyl-ACP methyl ester carboxylesterase